MSLQHKPIQLSLVGMILLSLLASVYLFSWKRKRAPKPTPPATISKHKVETKPEDALKYWTEEKKRDAKGTNMPHVDAPKQGK